MVGKRRSLICKKHKQPVGLVASLKQSIGTRKHRRDKKPKAQ